MGVRLYNPDTGRFLSVDPAPGGGANAYVYCSSDPINCTDTAGLWDYYFTYYLGSRAPIYPVFRDLRQYFSWYFPIPGAAGQLTGVGQTMNLRPFGMYFPVRVSRLSQYTYSAGWTFATRPGHPDYPGYLAFDIYRIWYYDCYCCGRSVYLKIHGHIPTLGWWTPAWVLASYNYTASRTWAPFANTMRERAGQHAGAKLVRRAGGAARLAGG